jgi:hypothetical protein
MPVEGTAEAKAGSQDEELGCTLAQLPCICASTACLSGFSAPSQARTEVREGYGAESMPQWSPCGLPQEGALHLLKKLNSCQMSIQLLQVCMWGPLRQCPCRGERPWGAASLCLGRNF